MDLITVASCNLDQWALDFEGNLARIVASAEEAKGRGARYRLGPELEIPGYGCLDAFLENDTVRHSWEVVDELLAGDLTDGMIVDVGMPVLHAGVRYNCRVLLAEGEVALIRPKMALASDGNYRESRYFAAWGRRGEVEDLALPAAIRERTGRSHAPIGDVALETLGTVIAAESCEELFTPASPHIGLALAGVEIVANGSGSHHELRKLQRRLELILSASRKGGGVYLYANQQGCDGDRLYYDGCALIAVNGEIVAQGSQFSPRDVEVVSATVDLDAVRSQRAAFLSRMRQAAAAPAVPRVRLAVDLADRRPEARAAPPRAPRIHAPEEEIALGPACWLWDYLRRSGAAGFFVPLSGGSDSAAVAALVGSMCQLVTREVEAGNRQVLLDLRRVTGRDPDGDWRPASGEAGAAELAERLLTTCYMGSENSSPETRGRARALADEIGADHLEVPIDRIAGAFVGALETLTGRRPRFAARGGSRRENLALQNVQARTRMVLAYLLAQLVPWWRDREGFLLVLGTSNVDEALRGYVTKYDASSADLNPIGSIGKEDLRAFLRWGAGELGYPSLAGIADAVPTAELEPITDANRQADEPDMGMTYAELARFGRLRKVERCGPVEMFEHLVREWDHLPPAEVADKVERFFRFYALNRHKATVLTPAYHAESYSPDDHRFDLRQFLYRVSWPWQFRAIRRRVEAHEAARGGLGGNRETDEAGGETSGRTNADEAHRRARHEAA